jgi:hypothetical protein
LAKAHQEQTIASNWIEAHQKSDDPNTPVPQLASPRPSASPAKPNDIWVKTKECNSLETKNKKTGADHTNFH